MAKKYAKKNTKATDELLRKARERFKLCEENEFDDRDRSLSDQRFENGEQWSDKDRQDRQGRPCLTINRVTATTRQIVGDSRQNRPSIKIRAAGDGAKKDVANILTGLVRNIENISNAESIYDFGISSAVRGGWGAWRVVTEYAHEMSFDQEIKIKRIVNPHSVWIDPNATEHDMSDARFAFVTEEMPVDEFEATYPDESPEDWEEKVRTDWVKDKNVRIAEYFYKDPVEKKIYLLEDGSITDSPEEISKEGDITFVRVNGELKIVEAERTTTIEKVKWCKMSGGALLEQGEWAGKYIPIVVCNGEEIWVEGKRERRSAIRFAQDSQRLYNWARSNSVETMALSPKQPFILTADEVEGHEEQWAAANTTPQPYLLYNKTDGVPGRPQRQPGSIVDQGAVQEAMLASDDIKATTNTYDAAIGARSNETSGKAIRERRIEGDTATFEFHDNQAKAIQYTGRIIVDLIPKIYDTERIVRILGEDGKESMVTINKTIESPGPNENPVQYDLKVGKYDVVVDVGPGFATKRQEAAEGMINTLQFFPQGAPILVPMIAKNSDWPEADAVADKLEAIAEGQPDPKQQMDVAKGQLDIEGKQLTNTQRKLDIQQDVGNIKQESAQIAQQATLLTLRKLGIV